MVINAFHLNYKVKIDGKKTNWLNEIKLFKFIFNCFYVSVYNYYDFFLNSWVLQINRGISGGEFSFLLFQSNHNDACSMFVIQQKKNQRISVFKCYMLVEWREKFKNSTFSKFMILFMIVQLENLFLSGCVKSGNFFELKKIIIHLLCILE